MPRFFFHIRSPDGLIEDTDGVEMADVLVAGEEAELAVREIVAERIQLAKAIDRVEAMEVADTGGKIIRAVSFVEILSSTVT